MKTINYVSQKTSKTTALIFTTLIALATTEASHADTCSLKKHDLMVDSAALMEKILSESSTADGSFKKVSYTPDKSNVLDHKFHNIDRTLPYFEDMNGIGILTGKTFSNKPQTYGSATLIGSCYVLTNKHVVKMLLEERGQSLSEGESFNFSVGQPKNCNAADQFEAINQQVTLVDHGDNKLGPNAVQSDWAILKLKKPVKNVKPVNVGSAYTTERQMLVRGGFPYQEVKKNASFAYLSAQYIQNTEFISGGVATMSDNISRPGISGSGIFYSKFTSGLPRATLAGISAGIDENGKGVYLPLVTIKAMVKNSGKLNWKEVTKVSDTESCD